MCFTPSDKIPRPCYSREISICTRHGEENVLSANRNKAGAEVYYSHTPSMRRVGAKVILPGGTRSCGMVWIVLVYKCKNLSHYLTDFDVSGVNKLF